MATSVKLEQAIDALKVEFPLIRVLDEDFVGEQVWLVSSSTGINLGCNRGLQLCLVNGVSICLEGSGSVSHRVGVANVIHAARLTCLVTGGDASSHGATWPHILRALEDLKLASNGAIDGHLDLVSMLLAECHRRNPGEPAWQVLWEQFQLVRQSDLRFLRVNTFLEGLRAFAQAQTQLERGHPV